MNDCLDHYRHIHDSTKHFLPLLKQCLSKLCIESLSKLRDTLSNKDSYSCPSFVVFQVTRLNMYSLFSLGQHQGEMFILSVSER